MNFKEIIRPTRDVASLKIGNNDNYEKKLTAATVLSIAIEVVSRILARKSTNPRKLPPLSLLLDKPLIEVWPNAQNRSAARRFTNEIETEFQKIMPSGKTYDLPNIDFSVGTKAVDLLEAIVKVYFKAIEE